MSNKRSAQEGRVPGGSKRLALRKPYDRRERGAAEEKLRARKGFLGMGGYNVVFELDDNTVIRVLLPHDSIEYTPEFENAMLASLKLDAKGRKRDDAVRALFPPEMGYYTAVKFDWNSAERPGWHPLDEAGQPEGGCALAQRMTKLLPFETDDDEFTRVYRANEFAAKVIPAIEAGLVAPDLKYEQLGFTKDGKAFVVDTGGCCVVTRGVPSPFEDFNMTATYPATDFLTYLTKRLIKFHLLLGHTPAEQDELVRDFPKWHLWAAYQTWFAAACTFVEMIDLYFMNSDCWDHDAAKSFGIFQHENITRARTWGNEDKEDEDEEDEDEEAAPAEPWTRRKQLEQCLDSLEGFMFEKLGAVDKEHQKAAAALKQDALDKAKLLKEGLAAAYAALGDWPESHTNLMRSFVDRCVQ